MFTRAVKDSRPYTSLTLTVRGLCAAAVGRSRDSPRSWRQLIRRPSVTAMKHDTHTSSSWLTKKGLLRVPEITALFWIIKGLSTAMGE